ncbi:MAG: glycosyltransferase family 39 protein [Acidobacteria bacterium]|nr:glycosyltransferase family 39 protein [Acidobacteriota bacterium]
MSSPIPSPPNRLNVPLGREEQGRLRRIYLETAGVVALSLVCLIPYFHLPISDPDEGIIACGAERILGGQVPYRDFFSELGPISFYLHALFFKLGTINITSMRLTVWLLGGATAGLLYILARKILRPLWAVVAATILPLVCYPTVYRVSHHWWADFFLLLTVLALSASLACEPDQVSEPRSLWCALAGALAATALLTMQTKGFWAILMGLLFLWTEPWFSARREYRFRRVLFFLGGAAAVVGLMAAYFAAQGALGAWMDANLVFLFTNYRAYLDVPQASSIQMIIHIGGLASRQFSVHFSLYFIGYLFFVFVAPVVALGGTAASLIATRRNPPLESTFVFLLFLQGAATFISEFHSPDVAHLVWGSPLLLILFVYQWEHLSVDAHTLKRPLQIAGVGVMALVLLTAGRKAIIMSEIDGRVETRRGVLYVSHDESTHTQAMIDAIQQRVPPGGETFFYPYMAEIYFLTATRNPTRHDVLLQDFHRPEQIAEAVANLERARPAYVFGFDRIQLLTVRPHFPDDVPDMIRPHPVGKALAAPGSGYQLESIVEDMEVWARNP